MPIITETLRRASDRLRQCGIEYAQLDAQVLLAHLLNKDRLYLHAHGHDPLSDTMTREYDVLIQRRCANEPVAYITGHQEFMSLDFNINKNVLIPRADTEILTEFVIEEAKGYQTRCEILDLCCGSGCIGISVAYYVPYALVTLSDISQPALDVSKTNIQKHELSERVHAIQSDLFQCHQSKQYDIIVSNPPYISEQQWKTLQSNVTDYEPSLALLAENDGLAFYQAIIKQAPKHLNPGGLLAFEIGYDQAQPVSEMMHQHGYLNIKILQDYAGQDRVVCAYLEK